MGAAQVLLENKVRAKRVYCTSGGCATAIYYLLDLRNDISLQTLLKALPQGRRRHSSMFHALGRDGKKPRGIELARKRMVAIMREMLDLRPDAYRVLSGRMYVFLTAFPLLQTRYVSHWSSNDQVMDTFLATSCIPGVDTQFKPVTCGSTWFVDGGFLAEHPVRDKHTVCVSTEKISQWWSKAYAVKKSEWPEISRKMSAKGSLEVKKVEYYERIYHWGRIDALRYLQSRSCFC
jgi:predicted acylesterase/phospholipase RssA